MKNDVFQKLIYQLVSNLFVLPIYKFVFRGQLIGRENIPQKNSYIMVSNHGSLLDPPLLGHALRRNISFMAKAELFKIPVLGFIIKACGAYPVKRGIVDKNTIKTACKKLSNENCIGIFIDGTRQKNGRVNKPKQGAALLAFKNQKLLLPVAIVNSHRLIRFKFFIPLFSKIVIKVGEPVQPPQSSSKNDLNSVTIYLQDKINNLIG
ncbi:1-acyl-sn-glycerol-3-phosphate acyltransferase [Prochlorococcus marinus str. XMU1401]|jgi:1-acyl-sn-glycerol-3-phosphate acyltransferase|uniref:1-acyl-sn-glycerol-3-phosphate acyltransferase n=1 Tax=Prochlorococcus marinus str. XMU1401 TaxID=2052594 RepID=A0A8I2BJE9_PROMR|nr:MULTISPECIES: lysophospholipid acyltransferase family protein [Prochlorococcus]MBO7012607.1 1-acyl-sn-glycerol-3-phosphate acyltransferase [Prochlorococcus marinus XMU1422]MCQ9198340.1 1-acyl-sn-glycerol-3-phosphate acyltransferase [Prochlorococcus marinus XMU1429]MCR8541639.1 1-acyl-sn-glycerol-3-phosphate acyltransferase [Prochlorococcus marinus XMU1423]AQL30345.1 1-acyl-sn-glycerol-3-phosphate acyltransferase [Prochlorococcus sp. RS50]AQL32710.1 1-acyl-sn-glycerol-3-phosphate acyltransfe